MIQFIPTRVYDVIPWRYRQHSPQQWAVIRWQDGPCRYVRVSTILHNSERSARIAAGFYAATDFRTVRREEVMSKLRSIA